MDVPPLLCQSGSCVVPQAPPPPLTPVGGGTRRPPHARPTTLQVPRRPREPQVGLKHKAEADWLLLGLRALRTRVSRPPSQWLPPARPAGVNGPQLCLRFGAGSESPECSVRRKDSFLFQKGSSGLSSVPGTFCPLVSVPWRREAAAAGSP
ncbi:uncharacterized protein LOC125612350 isoform X2 [Marmota marmota marmota]|uniref:uncharacterized protein LOC125612350 isoform X2 n=1 Tax=Marmota marmota marmota TaxID=9994 RepID=UPI0020934F7A|nr:uncharacterized protein LOC125612350 isoform X2 [Marmota marmota marmota]